MAKNLSACNSEGEKDSPNALTPTRRNKRKMSEPRRRGDIDVTPKRVCGSAGTFIPGKGEDINRNRFAEFPPDTPEAATEDRLSPLDLNTTSSSSSPSVDTSRRLHGPHPAISSSSFKHSSAMQSADAHAYSRRMRKNYKNMTRERRIEANARERTRVHTISAAFDALRRAVPSYSYNQKLSKLAILRIACSYILALARLNDLDCNSGRTRPETPAANNFSFAECVDLCTKTIQTEGRARRRN